LVNFLSGYTHILFGFSAPASRPLSSFPVPRSDGAVFLATHELWRAERDNEGYRRLAIDPFPYAQRIKDEL